MGRWSGSCGGWSGRGRVLWAVVAVVVLVLVVAVVVLVVLLLAGPLEELALGLNSVVAVAVDLNDVEVEVVADLNLSLYFGSEVAAVVVAVATERAADAASWPL